MSFQKKQWWKSDKGKVHTQLLEHVQKIEQDQFGLFDRFVKLAALYDPNNAVTPDGMSAADRGYITENVVATNVDTVSSVISAIDLRARVMTDGGDWDQQQLAQQQELYAEGMEKLLDVAGKSESVFKEGPGIRGTGLLYVWEDRFATKRVMVAEPVLADDIIVDERECRTGRKPTQMHRRHIVDRDDLIARFPDQKEAIAKAHNQSMSGMRQWAGYRPLEENEVVVIHSHRLPRNGKGREVLSIDGADLFDEPWTEDFFPYAELRWSGRGNGWYGISLAERIMGHQGVLNRSNWQIDRLVNLNAIPTTYVGMMDADLVVKVQRPGAIVPIKGNPPVTPTPPAISPEVYKRVGDVKASASEESGVNRMLSQGVKPSGLDSGAALRELNNATTQRFATQEKAYERYRRDVVMLIFACAKQMGKDAPVIKHSTRWGTEKITWSKIDLGDLKVQVQMASGLPRTVAGRTQMVLEWAQAGLLDTDEVRDLLDHPDVERSLSLFTAGVEALENAFTAIAKGKIVMPEPFMPLKACVERGTKQYLAWWNVPKVPESVLEALRQFIVQAADMMAPKEPAMPAGMPANGNMPMDPAMDPANGNMPIDPLGGMDPAAPPEAALAAQAMQLRAV